MRAIVDAQLCIGCTLCVQTCPDVFRMEGEKAAVFKDPVPAASHDCSRKAAEECPVQAITITA